MEFGIRYVFRPSLEVREGSDVHSLCGLNLHFFALEPHYSKCSAGTSSFGVAGSPRDAQDALVTQTHAGLREASALPHNHSPFSGERRLGQVSRGDDFPGALGAATWLSGNILR